MNKRKKELAIIIPLAIISTLVIISTVISYYISTEISIQPIDTSCQEGWYKYDLESGTLCSKTELTESQIEEYEG